MTANKVLRNNRCTRIISIAVHDRVAQFEIRLIVVGDSFRWCGGGDGCQSVVAQREFINNKNRIELHV